MRLQIYYRGQLPEDAEYPLSDPELQEYFHDILLQDSVFIMYKWYQNTSDVLIARNNWDAPQGEWDMQVIAAHKDKVRGIRECLFEGGLLKLREWLVETNQVLGEQPDVWACYTLTIRFEDQRLIYDPSRSVRPGRRPEDWPPYGRNLPPTPPGQSPFDWQLPDE